MRRRSEKLLKQLRAELKNVPAQSANESAIEQALETCIAEVRRLNESDQIFLSRTTLETFVRYFEKMPDDYTDDEKRSLLESIKSSLEEK